MQKVSLSDSAESENRTRVAFRVSYRFSGMGRFAYSTCSRMLLLAAAAPRPNNVASLLSPRDSLRI